MKMESDEECQPHCPANVNPSKVALDVVTGKETIGQGYESEK